MDRLLAELRAIHGDVALFAHGHVLRVLAARWLGLPAADGALLALATATVSVLGWERETAVVRLWNMPPGRARALGGHRPRAPRPGRAGLGRPQGAHQRHERHEQADRARSSACPCTKHTTARHAPATWIGHEHERRLAAAQVLPAHAEQRQHRLVHVDPELQARAG